MAKFLTGLAVWSVFIWNAWALPASKNGSAMELERLLQAGDPHEIDKFLSGWQSSSGQPGFENNFIHGLLALRREQYEVALAAFTVIPVSSPLYLDARNNLAVIQAMQGKPEQAKKTLEEALRSHSAVAVAYKNLNEIKFHLVNKSQALALQAMEPGKASKPSLLVATGALLERSQRSSPSAGTAAGGPVVPTPHTPVSAPPPAKAAPASAPATTPVPSTAASDARPETPAHSAAARQATQALHDWSRAWESKNIEAYFAAYDPEFQPADGRSLTRWKQDRQDRILSKGRIRIQMGAIDANAVDAHHVRLRFVQTYRADQLNATSKKTIDMKWSGQRWLIVRERASDGGK
jgi:tetratricopeptide (TPR) repeat protein